MSRETDLRSIDYGALTAPIDPAEVAAFEAETRPHLPGWMPRRAPGGVPPLLVVLTVLFIGIPGAVTLVLLLLGIVLALWWPAVTLAPAALTFAATASVLIVPAIRSPRTGFGWQEHYRVSRFAWENGLVYSAGAAKARYRGVLFNNLPALAYNRISPTTGRFFEIGSLRYGRQDTADSAMSESGHRGFLAINIGGKLPHILLDAKGNNGMLGGIGAQFADQPTVSLEGNFNEHFTLYCPLGYERDALYILTPDLMVDLLDETLAFDVELIDEWMFVYAMKPFDLTVPGIHERLFRLIETVGTRVARRSARYRDDQYSSPKAFAAKGQGPRMAPRLPTLFVVMMGALLASISWIPTAGILGVLDATLP